VAFQETTGREISDALAGFGDNPKGLVLDLRGNPADC
jgi:carboxyl-terminal processing protease